MFIRTGLSICVFLLVCSRLFGQDPMFSQINHHQLCINPAYAGNSPYARLMAGYRNQWPGLGNAFSTYFISYDQYVKAISSNFGVAIMRDVQADGSISRTSGDFSYSYPIELSNTTILSLGVQASLVQKQVNSSTLILPDQNPYGTSGAQEILGDKSIFYPDFSAGAAFYFGEQYLLSFSVHHLTRPNESTSGTINSTPMQLNVQAMARYSLIKRNRGTDGFIFYPGIMAQVQGPYSFVNWGCNLQYNVIVGGLWVRHDFTLNFNTFIIQAGYAGGAANIIYSYDAWVPKNDKQIKNYGAHEVTFIYHFKYNDPKKRMRTLKCPKF